ncbi:PREDICTED: putative UPF0481 protein At3g02645 [Lupinus angustifolius]|uniref:putative UPF0481 protein At3g02645 n=1 Tax=Lupinus angustifolius TaxID=3871 RepID=UPI00092EF60E|nr:PREDICTED: putative UPF0481 protein At3g02645 [Lupinus angustifolius]
MASNAVSKSITINPNNIIVDHAVLNVEELMKHQKYHATFCVYRVPKSLSCTKPEAFTPQFVGLGPYHHCIPQICFDYLKISALTSVLNHTNVLTKVVQQLSNSNLASLIHDCYDTSIVFKDYTLLYLMTVDALFLYDLLSNSVIVTEDEESVETVTKVDLKSSIFAAKHRMPLVNYGGVELTKDAIIRDIFMLENQIPIHIVEEIMKVVVVNMETEKPHPQYEDMGSKMLHFCKALCPFVYSDQELSDESEEPMKNVHLLDLMYHLMLRDPNPTPDEDDPNLNPDEHEPNFNPDEHDPELNPDEYDPNFNPDKDAEQSDSTLTRLKKMYRPVYSLIVWGTMPDGEPIIGGGEGCIYYGICIIMRLLAILILPGLCILFAFLFIVTLLVILIVLLLRLFYPAVVFFHNLFTNINHPLMKFITLILGLVKNIYGLFFQKSTNFDIHVEIPSVTELHQAGIHFNPTYGVISSSENHVLHEEFIFYLPKIRLDHNSEVIMRNLVAYESLTQSNCLYVTKYVELMRSLIRTAKDVKVLVDEKIIQTKLSDAKVMQIFNEINKSIRPTNTADLDEIINRVNCAFHRLKFEKLRKFLVKYVLPIWIVLVLAAIIGCSILLVDLIRVTLEGYMQDIIRYITSAVIKVFHWF